MITLFKDSSPRFRLLVFGAILLLMTGLGAGVMLVMISALYDVPLMDIETWMKDYDNPVVVNALMWMNDVSQVFSFLLPPLIFYLLAGGECVNRFMFRSPGIFLMLAPVWLISSAALIDLSSVFNTWIIPENSSFGQSLKSLEEEAGAMTSAMLSNRSTGGIIFSLISVAIIPAFCEEILFRGTLQPLIAKVTRNIHAAIWITAAIFAFIHFQFYGFLPRMILGAMLGYLVMWSGSLWTAVVAHLLNNALAMFLFYQYGDTITPLSEDDSGQWIVYITSALLFVMFIYWFRKWSKWENVRTEYLGLRNSESLL